MSICTLEELGEVEIEILHQECGKIKHAKDLMQRVTTFGVHLHKPLNTKIWIKKGDGALLIMVTPCRF